MNETEKPIFIILGRVWKVKDGPETAINIMLSEADDDSAVREALNALSERGYHEAEFDQIGTLTEEPVDEPFVSAYQGAAEGEIAIVEYEDGETASSEPIQAPRRDGRFIDDDDPDYDPFAALKDWKPDG